MVGRNRTAQIGSRDDRTRGGAHGTRTSGIPCGANRKRIGTAKPGNRDKRDQLARIGLELAVSGADSAGPLSQDPAKARGFLGGPRVAAAKSPETQTGWRSEWNSSIPCGANRKRIRTAKVGNRDERGQLPAVDPERAVSGFRLRPSAKTPRKRGSFWDGRG